MSLVAADKFALVNKTFPKEKEVLAAYKDSALYRNLDFAIKANQDKNLPVDKRTFAGSQTRILSFNGPTGYGKTSATEFITKTMLKRHDGEDLQVLSLYMPWVKMDRMQLVIPYFDEESGLRRMRPVTSENLLNADVIILEESDRVSDAQVKNFMMELIEGSIGGVKLRNGLTIVHLNNPKGSSGVGGVDKDIAQATRIRHINLDMDDLPWQIGLAGTYPTLDLANFLNTVEGFPAEVRLQLPPRTMEHVLYAAGNGFPAIWGLPMIAGKRDSISYKGKAVTAKYLKEMVEAAGFSYIRDEGVDLIKIRQAYETIISHGNNLFIAGPAGMGKSQFTNKVIDELGCDTHLIQAPNTAASRHVMTLPGGENREVLQVAISDKFNPKREAGQRPLVAYIDEIGRARDDVKNVLLEVCGPTRRLGDIKLPFKAIVATDNPAEVDGFKMSLAGSENRALAERFHLSINIPLGTFEPMTYLLQKYGELFEPFAAWWSSDLNDRERLIVNPRVMENMFSAYTYARKTRMKIEDTMEWLQMEFPYIGEQRFGPVLHGLRNRLQQIVVADITLLVEDCDDIEAAMQNTADPEAIRGHEILVAEVLTKEDMANLTKEENLRAVMRILRHVTKTYRQQIVSSAASSTGSVTLGGKTITRATLFVHLMSFVASPRHLEDEFLEERLAAILGGRGR